jgi:AcrR family transcriptional regulator
VGDQKDDVFFKICNSVLKLESLKGHLNWRISDVAKDSDITRSLIYYYFGKKKDVLLEESYRYMLDLIFDLPQKKTGSAQERLEEVLGQVKKMPYLFVLFFLQKDQDTELGELIRSAEAKLLQRLKAEYPQKTDEEILKTYIFELGVVSYKNLSSVPSFS